MNDSYERTMTLQQAVQTLDFPTWEEVGAFLISQGITESSVGDSRLYSCRCPVSQYLHKLGFLRASVSYTHASPYFMAEEAVALPDAVRGFITQHDHLRLEINYGVDA